MPDKKNSQVVTEYLPSSSNRSSSSTAASASKSTSSAASTNTTEAATPELIFPSVPNDDLLDARFKDAESDDEEEVVTKTQTPAQ